MKHLFYLVFTCLLVVSSNAQNFIETHFQNLIGLENNTEVYVNGKLFDYAGHFLDEEEDEDIGNIKEFVTSIEEIQVLVARDIVNPTTEYQKGISIVDGNYEQLVVVRDGHSNFSLYIDESGGVVNELIGIGTDDKEFILVSILGEMDLDKIGELVSKIQTEALNNKTVLRNMDFDEMKVYPNPASTESVLNIEIPERMIGGEVRVFDMNGLLIQSYQLSEQIQQIKSDGWIPGYYIVEIAKEEVSMKKKILIAK